MLIDHIKRKWEHKKRPNGKFNPTVKDFAQLRSKAMVYDTFELMALYDEFIVMPDDFYSKQGYSITCFCGAIDFLVDRPGWKAKAEKYRADFCKPQTLEEKEDAEKITRLVGGAIQAKTFTAIAENRKAGGSHV